MASTMSVGERIQFWRENRKLTQENVALSLNVPQARYSRIESGNIIPDNKTLKQLSDILGVPVAELTSGASYYIEIHSNTGGTQVGYNDKIESKIEVEVYKKLVTQLEEEVTFLKKQLELQLEITKALLKN